MSANKVSYELLNLLLLLLIGSFFAMLSRDMAINNFVGFGKWVFIDFGCFHAFLGFLNWNHVHLYGGFQVQIFVPVIKA